MLARLVQDHFDQERQAESEGEKEAQNANRHFENLLDVAERVWSALQPC